MENFIFCAVRSMSEVCSNLVIKKTECCHVLVFSSMIPIKIHVDLASFLLIFYKLLVTRMGMFLLQDFCKILKIHLPQWHMWQ